MRKLTKQELAQVLEEGWTERREKLKERAEKNSLAVQEWKKREAAGLPHKNPRKVHYLPVKKKAENNVRDWLKREKQNDKKRTH